MARSSRILGLVLAALLLLSASVSAQSSLPAYQIVIAFPGVEQKDIQLVQEQINKLTLEKINATVKITTIGFASWVQQTNLMMASGEKLDLLWTSSFFNFTSLVAKGQLKPLDTLVAKYGKDITSALEPAILGAAKVDNALYGIPSIRDFAADQGFILRKDLASKHKIDLSAIKSAADMAAVFKVIKSNEPTIIPFATTQTNTIAELLGQGVYDKLGNFVGVVALNDSSLKVVNFYETKWYADMLSLVRQWFQAGYLSQDAATIKEPPDSLVKADKAFAYAYSGKPGIDTQEGRKTGKEISWVPLTPPISTTSAIQNGMVSIPVSCKDRVTMLINLWYGNKDLVNLFDNGIEGTHYVKTNDGRIKYPEGINAGTTRWIPINFRVGNNFLAYIWNTDSADLWTRTEKFNKEALRSRALGFSFDAEPVKTEIAAVTNVVSQYRMGLDTGTMDPKSVLPEFLGKLKASGIDKIISEKQAQLDKWVKAAR
jgi:putative aldouronate transport system substrate-binding protein